MPTKITLKERKASDTINIPLERLHRIMALPEDEAKDVLYQIGTTATNGTKPAMHDKDWLEMIVNWTPEGGLPITEMSKWLRLASNLNKIEVDGDAEFVLSSFQVDLIWERLRDERFKLRALSPAFVDFLMDFQAATGRHFEKEEPDVEADDPDHSDG